MATTVTKAKIVEEINQTVGLPKEEIYSIIDSILNEIKSYLIKDGIVKISSFGTFIINHKKDRPGNIPNTAQKVVIKARKSISFRPSKTIKGLIN
ncbi:DNA-binding protein [Wolbachia pipientis]|uniref:Histone-like DNA-binding protein n=1 Tax=Wolbachia pipientis TaxID=955 RepID=A0A1E7QJ90_WOLPI|nr:HU family DNA-binding protein [Wolbachia pipientis]OEY86538.1 DNA-binding protein [Wolbachia pipientis]